MIGYRELTVPRKPAAASSPRGARAATPKPPPMLAETAEFANRSNEPLTQQKPGPDADPPHATDLQWHSLALRILEWEGVDNPKSGLSERSTERAAAATGIDHRISSNPTQNTATAPEDVDLPQIEHPRAAPYAASPAADPLGESRTRGLAGVRWSVRVTGPRWGISFSARPPVARRRCVRGPGQPDGGRGGSDARTPTPPTPAQGRTPALPANCR